MKARSIIIIAIVLVFALSGCASGVPQEKYDALVDELESLQDELDDLKTESINETAVPEKTSALALLPTEAPETAPTKAPLPAAFDSADIISKLVTTEYTYSDDWYSYGTVVVKNTSVFNLHIQITATFLDADGNLIGTGKDEDYAFESGYDAAYVFINEEPFSTVEYDFWIEEDDYYSSVLSSLALEVNSTSETAVVSVTNNGDRAAEFVEYIALFFKDGALVSYNWGYCVDGNDEILPGNTQRAEADAYEKFDVVEVYLSARSE